MSTVKRNLEKATRKTAPKKTSPKKRPNKKFIEQTAAFLGYTPCNDKVQLATLKVKNSLQKINNRAMSDDVNKIFTNAECKKLMTIMNTFVKDINLIINK